MRAASGPESIREPEEVFLVDRVEHRQCRPLDDLVLQCGDRQRALPPVGLGYIDPSRRQRPVRSPLDPAVQIVELVLKVCRIALPRQPVHAGSRFLLERIEGVPQQFRIDVVEERGEPFLLPLPCSLPYAFQRLCHASPVLHPERALPARIPLGLGPWLPRLRSGPLRLVRRLHSYYGLVRLPASVHHRLWLLAFPMRTLGASCHRPDAGYPSFRRDLSARDVLFDPGRVDRTSHHGYQRYGPCGVRQQRTTSAPSDKGISWLNHTPHAAAVYASWPPLPPAHATLASRRLARPYLGWTCTSRSRQPPGAFPLPTLRSPMTNCTDPLRSQTDNQLVP